jgi:hypothetical protein
MGPLVRQPVVGINLQSRVLKRLQERFDSCHVIGTLDRATGGELYVFGGTVRRILFDDKQSGDLDLMVPNGDRRAFEALNDLRIPFQLNRSGHHRYQWNAQQIDLFEPREFYRGFDNVEGALRYFDLKINAIALHIGTGCIVDPFGILSQVEPLDPGINWFRWQEMLSVELNILAIRLVKIMYETPNLAILESDADRLRADVIPQIYKSSWSSVHNRFPLGKDAFLKEFGATVLSRIKR